ncbi:non-specific serine/threonine protein kinase [Saccharopolyspora shandongensis]|uniref:Non-specific serine/threonine protein kinase n=1 Tax=Saccharopolyspora shandongensis TaxID=418495 RepID=A0A1H3B7K2_9PSEU|nr:non-specific serine/threonine protein kinase [Saccharopolyspora shandongensis]
MVTLTGVGGTGKSRLALHVAWELRRAFADGVWLVGLAALRDPALLRDTVASALGLTDRSNRDPETVLVNYVAEKRLLLVLDNCEHLLDDSAHLVARLLRAAPGLRVLATSRAPLDITGEYVWQVPPLSLPPEGSPPSADCGRRYEALELFEQRAADVVSGFALTDDNTAAVARLCRRLDGLPLAIELAAVQLRTLSVEQILERLQDRFQLLAHGDRAAPARHQTLRAAIEWSFELCTELERTVWARLSVFPGEFDMTAAEDVCVGEGVLVEEVFTGVAGLVDKSLLIKRGETQGARYRMLETIRQYGREQLSKEKEETVRRRHRDYYLRLAERAEADWFGPDQAQWLERFHAEQPNVRVALEFCLTRPGQARTGLRMAGALYWYWIVRAVRDGRWWLEQALACDTEPSPERANALWGVGYLAVIQGDTAYALVVLSECVDLARVFDDEITLGHAQQFLGLARWFADELPAAAAAYEQAVAHYRNAGAQGSLPAVVLCCLGTVVGMLGDSERGVALCQECVTDCQANGERWGRSWGLWHLALAHWLQRDLPQVTAYATEALRLKHALHDHLGISWCVEMLGWVAAAEEDAQRAAVLFGMADTLWEQIGEWLTGWATAREWSSQCQTKARDILGSRVYEAALQQGKRFTLEETVAYVLGEQPHTEPVAPVAASELPLTRREREVAKLVAQGMSNKDIAVTLMVARRTAESHVEHILTKLGFTSRTQIAAWFTEQGFR